MNDFPLGKYKHFKGNFYEVLGVAIHTETNEELVIYKPLYKSDSFKPGAWFTRSKAMFTENVFRDGEEKQRFKFVGNS